MWNFGAEAIAQEILNDMRREAAQRHLVATLATSPRQSPLALARRIPAYWRAAMLSISRHKPTRRRTSAWLTRLDRCDRMKRAAARRRSLPIRVNA
jgi:hypothetical protein